MLLCKERLPRLGVEYAVVKGNTGVHIVTKWQDECLCTCISWHIRRKCKHVKYLGSEELGRWFDMEFKDVEDVISGSKESRKFPSSLNAINELFGEEAYNSDEIVALCGEPKVGKTLLCVQEAVWLASNGYNVMYLDTEGGTEQFMKKWLPILKKRFKFGEKKNAGKILYGCEKDLVKILSDFGIKANINVKGNKTEFVVDEINYEEANIIDMIKKAKIDFIIIDSVSAPLRVFPTAQQNFPARADCTAIWLTGILKIMEECNVGVIVTVHATFNPASVGGGTVGSVAMRGGIVMHHYCKRVLYIAKRGKKGFENYRKIWLVRAEDMPEWSKVKAVKITDAGYVDVDDSKIAKLLTDKEKSMVEL